MEDVKLPARIDPAVRAYPVPASAVTAGDLSEPGAYPDLGEYVRALYQRRGLILLATLAGALVAAVVTQRMAKTYRAEAFLEIQTPNEDFLNLRDVNANAAPLASEEAYVQTQIALLRQNALLEQALRRLGLESHREFSPRQGRASSLLTAAGLQAPAPPPSMQLAVELARQRITIEPYKKSRIVRITYESGDPTIAADVPNMLGRIFIETSVEGRSAQARQTRNWLQPELADAKGKLDRAEAELRDFMRESGLGTNPGGETPVEERLRLLQGELAKAQAERITMESRQDTSAVPEVAAGNEVVRQLQIRLADLRREYADLNTLLRPESYKVARVKAQIMELETALQNELSQVRQRMKDAYAAAQKRESLLSEDFARQSVATSEVSSRVVRYQRLKSEAEAARAFYDVMRRKTNDAKVATAVRPANIKLVGAALPPLRPEKPSAPFNIAAGASLGLIAGIVLAASRGLSRRLTAPGQSEQFLSLPELGAIPVARPVGARMRRLLDPGGTRPEVGIERIALEQRSSPLSESFRWTLVSLLSAKIDNQTPQVMVVTSPLSGDGKTTIVSNLGITLAQTGKRVLLVDGDLRHARLHEVFNLRNDFGLSNLLHDESAVENFSISGLGLAWVPGLWVLPSGSLTGSIDSLLYSQGRMKALVCRLREEFDYILIDAPSVSGFADSRVLADNADGVVLVVRANTDDRTALATAQRLALDGVPVLGTILNSWDGWNRRLSWLNRGAAVPPPARNGITGTTDDSNRGNQ